MRLDAQEMVARRQQASQSPGSFGGEHVFVLERLPSEKRTNNAHPDVTFNELNASPLSALESTAGRLFIDRDNLTFDSTLGAGEDTVVERAEFLNPKRLSEATETVIVKTYRPGVVREADLLRLVGELAKLHLLRHRHIAAIHGIGSFATASGQLAVCDSLFYVEEYVGSYSLRDIIEQQQLRPAERVYSAAWALRWALQVARGLAHIHTHGWPNAHGDVRADNVLLTDNDLDVAYAKLTDLRPHRCLPPGRRTALDFAAFPSANLARHAGLRAPQLREAEHRALSRADALARRRSLGARPKAKRDSLKVNAPPLKCSSFATMIEAARASLSFNGRSFPSQPRPLARCSANAYVAGPRVLPAGVSEAISDPLWAGDDGDHSPSVLRRMLTTNVLNAGPGVQGKRPWGRAPSPRGILRQPTTPTIAEVEEGAAIGGLDGNPATEPASRSDSATVPCRRTISGRSITESSLQRAVARANRPAPAQAYRRAVTATVGALHEEGPTLGLKPEALQAVAGRSRALLYAAPERLLGRALADKADVFSFGVLLYELLARQLLAPLGGKADIEQDDDLAAEVRHASAVAAGRRPALPAHWPAPVQSLLTSCWAADPRQRPAMADVVDRLSDIMEGNATMRALDAAQPLSRQLSKRHSFSEQPGKRSEPSCAGGCTIC